jgi:hypothetical protein
MRGRLFLCAQTTRIAPGSDCGGAWQEKPFAWLQEWNPNRSATTTLHPVPTTVYSLTFVALDVEPLAD